jgi:membrane-bound lytic murein transglycosylase B
MMLPRIANWLTVSQAAALLASLLLAGPASSLDLTRPDVQEFITALVKKDRFDRAFVAGVLSSAESKQSILDAMSRPAEKVKPWFEYRDIFMTSRRISGGVDFFREHEARLRRVSLQTGVPAEVIVAIIGVETFYGTRTGSYRLVDSLATLGFDYPPRGEFFRKQLRELFLLAREERLDINTLTGSYAGALGPPQFIPSSYRSFAVDGNGDGRRNLVSDWDDIVASVANYFVRHDWQPGQTVATSAALRGSVARPDDVNELVLRDTIASLKRQGVIFDTDLPHSAPALLVYLEGREGDEYWVGFQNYYAITRYNRSVMYALAVHQLSQAIADGVRAQEAGRAAARVSP